ncbi:calcium-binding protein [Falsiroseomonas selenitidurans]|uniref:Calcium-binding protein n=1 Tax=Falsiroseomonas selenitidurans TaxID=2716335 RepID=A0ABX1DZ91_9PROT|nr:calcium-binding protein [Falsiroseomonas selenitidurans]NKC30227.1 calcium-binding protein [Falsiroseomonas selenitidurans]
MSLIYGTPGSDTLVGTGGDDTIIGGSEDAQTYATGNDMISGGEGNDLLFGGDGDDALFGNSGDDTLYGHDGADTLTGEWLIGGEGNDTLIGEGSGGWLNLNGQGGNDSIAVADAAEALLNNPFASGGEGDDTIRATGIWSASFTATGNSGDDLLDAGSVSYANPGHSIFFSGESGNDTLIGTISSDELLGGVGADSLVGGAGHDKLHDNSDALYYSEIDRENDTLTGGIGNDTLISTGGQDVVDGGDGEDRLILERISATESLEFLFNSLGVSTLTGDGTTVQNVERFDITLGSGNDTVALGAADDTISGGAGNDLLDGGAGRDDLRGGAGDDIYVVDNTGDTASEAIDSGTDTVLASVTFTLRENVERLILTGLAAIDGTGNELANTLTGNGAANQLNGRDGEDVLIGGTGRDRLTGGADADRFVYLAAGDSTSAARDIITDFSAGDLIDLSALDGNTGLAGLQSFTFLGQVQPGAGASIGAGEVSFHHYGGNTHVNIGLDGDGVRDMAIELTGLLALKVTDFLGAGLRGGAGNDSLVGLAGADTLDGAGGNDTLSGGAGEDVLIGGTGRDRLTGGADADRFVYLSAGDSTSAARDTITDFSAGDLIDLSALDGNTSLAGLQGFTFLGQVQPGAGASIGAGEVSFHHFGGNTHLNIGLDGDGVRDMAIELTGLLALQSTDFLGLVSDLNLVGGTGPDSLVGLAGADTLDGAGGNDTLSGDAGEDVLIGGTGRDRLTGGADADRFVYLSASDSTSAARDIITDFSAGDLIDLSALAGLLGFTFLGQVQPGAGASIGAGGVSFHHFGGNTHVNIGLDGDGVRDMAIELTGLLALQSADFLLA